MNRPPPVLAGLFFLLLAPILTGYGPNSSSVLGGDNADKPSSASITDPHVMNAWLQQIVDDKRVVGVSALVIERGEESYFGAFGQADRDERRKMSRNTIHRIYSMTKPIIGVALMTLYEDGLFELEDPLAEYVPEMADMKVFAGLDDLGGIILEPTTRDITVLDIMRHTAGLASGVSDGPEELQTLYAAADTIDMTNSLSELAQVIGNQPLLYQPGTQWRYSAAVDIQALMIERLSGKSVEIYLQEEIFDPLGMVDTGYYIATEDRKRLAEIYTPAQDGHLIVHPDVWHTEHVTRLWTMKPGGFGLTSTIDDFALFATMLLDGGSLDDIEILRPDTVKLMASDHLPADIGDKHFLPVNGKVGFGIDFAVRLAPPESDGWIYGVVGEYFWSGAAGTSFWIDPENELSAILMTQRLPFDGDLLKEFRDAVYNKVERSNTPSQ